MGRAEFFRARAFDIACQAEPSFSKIILELFRAEKISQNTTQNAHVAFPRYSCRASSELYFSGFEFFQIFELESSFQTEPGSTHRY